MSEKKSKASDLRLVEPSVTFDAGDFLDTPTCTAETKAIIANRLVQFLDNYCAARLYTPGVHRTLHESFGLDPQHEGRQRLYQRLCRSAAGRLELLRQIAEHTTHNDPAMSTADMQMAISCWASRQLPTFEETARRTEAIQKRRPESG